MAAENAEMNTDAVDYKLTKTNVSNQVHPKLTLETVKDIENELASYEKVR